MNSAGGSKPGSTKNEIKAPNLLFYSTFWGDIFYIYIYIYIKIIYYIFYIFFFHFHLFMNFLVRVGEAEPHLGSAQKGSSEAKIN